MVDASVELPLFAAQADYVAYDRLFPGLFLGAAHTVQAAAEIDRAVARERLIDAVVEIALKEGALRAFFVRDGEVVQHRVASRPAVTVRQILLDQATEELARRDFGAEVVSAPADPFSIGSATLLYGTYNGRTLVGLVVHHAFADAGSISALLRLIVDRSLSPESSKPVSVSMDYEEFASSSSMSIGDRRSAALRYWELKSADSPMMEVACDWGETEHRGEARILTVDLEEGIVWAAGSRFGVRPSPAACTLSLLLMSQEAEEYVQAVTTTVPGSMRELQGGLPLGPVTRTFPFVLTAMTRALDLEELFRLGEETWWRSWRAAELPLSEINRAIGRPPRAPTRCPYVVQMFPRSVFSDPMRDEAWRYMSLPGSGGRKGIGLELRFYEGSGSVDLVYAPERFRAETIETIAARLEILVRSIASGAETVGDTWC